MSLDEIAAIESRHKLDALYFDNGHHDPNGYVVLAHRDRGELLSRLRALPETADTIVIPKAAFDWLMGAGPDDQGKHFGDGRGDGEVPAYWWRSVFRRMCGDAGKGALS